ncbi:hypothetical protein BpHYR1_026915 [Brachionus plicatilis]
MNFKY